MLHIYTAVCICMPKYTCWCVSVRAYVPVCAHVFVHAHTRLSPRVRMFQRVGWVGICQSEEINSPRCTCVQPCIPPSSVSWLLLFRVCDPLLCAIWQSFAAIVAPVNLGQAITLNPDWTCQRHPLASRVGGQEGHKEITVKGRHSAPKQQSAGMVLGPRGGSGLCTF